ncbi:premnaspirodiene oxygenase-like [Heracleum sosnowskyi]|uniref:Premnaspirodiene oxygenase-like n=1 Tax=Heracleum sosnowskyi TaxID=360622 RepID=A0AAD8JBQ1_9APIA|nr:premnaspirodiene oxygenase-like [Heracleum sosnowskyi]
MDPQFILTFLSFLLILYFFLFFKKKTTNNAQNLPPGPRKLPIIGNIHELGGFSQHVVLSNMSKKHGPLMHLQLAEISAIVVSSSSIAKLVYKTHDLAFSDRAQVQVSKIILDGCKDVVFNRYDDYWRQMRKICTVDLLTSNKVKSFRSIREDEAWSLVESIKNSLDSPTNLTHKFCSLANSITCRAAIGEKSKYQDELIHSIEAMAFLGGGFDIVDLFPSYRFLHVFSSVKSQLKRIKSRLDDIFFNIIKEHEAKRATTKDRDGFVAGEEDLVDVLLRVQEKNGLSFPITSKNIQGVICDMLTGGTDTASNVLDWAMAELIRNPEVMKKAQAEPEDLDMTDVLGATLKRKASLMLMATTYI